MMAHMTEDTNGSTQAQEDVAKAVVTYTGIACALLYLCESSRALESSRTRD